MNLSTAESLASLPEDQWKEILASLTDAQTDALVWDWQFWARQSQKEPPGDWLTWLILAGRGFGKSRAGAETIRAWVCGSTPLAGGRYKRIALIAETAADARDVMVEGVSGLLAVHPPAFRPLYEPSKRRVTWKNGAVATLFNATEPDQLRGPNFDSAWCDELAKWQYARETWDMLQFGLRLGDRPRQIVTTTPRPVPVVKELLAASTTVVTRGATMENRGNLAASFLKQITARYAGTRLGRQELDAEVLDDNPSALWTRAMIEDATIKKAEMPRLARIAVAIDPSGTKGNDEGDDIGIVAAGKGNDGKMYVLADKTCQKGPAGWGKEAVDLYKDLAADVIVGERNFGGAMVEHVIRTVDDTVPFKEVTASRGKWVRAEPVSSLYERGMVKHVGSFPELEDEMCSFGPDGLADGKSPNRMDALVWAATELMLGDVGTAGIEETDWQDWKAPAFPSCAYVLAVVSPGYMGGDAADPPALTIWGVFHDDRGNPKVMLFYSWKGHVSGPDLAAAFEVLCSRNDKATIELKRIAKVLGLKAAPRFQVDRVILKSDGKADAVHRELVKVLANVSFSIEAVDPDRWGDDAARMHAVQHMFVDGMVFAPMSRVFARAVVDNVAEFPNGAHQGLANSTALALLYLRDTGLLLRAEEHSRNETEMGMHRGREKPLYAG